MTRFNPNGARVTLAKAEPQQKPAQQLMGLYNMWQSLAPETRDWIADLFRKKKMTDTRLDDRRTQNILDSQTVYDGDIDLNLMRSQHPELFRMSPEEAGVATDEFGRLTLNPIRDWNGLLIGEVE